MPALASLDGTRVLVVSRDRRFVAVTRFLLARRGFVVEAPDAARHVQDLVTRHDPDLVVIDGSECLVAAARTVAAIEALDPDVRVVVVAEQGDDDEGGLEVVPKWNSLDTLPAHVERVLAETM